MPFLHQNNISSSRSICSRGPCDFRTQSHLLQDIQELPLLHEESLPLLAHFVGTLATVSNVLLAVIQIFVELIGYLEKELANALPRVQCLELEIEHMTGKLVNES